MSTAEHQQAHGPPRRFATRIDTIGQVWRSLLDRVKGLVGIRRAAPGRRNWPPAQDRSEQKLGDRFEPEAKGVSNAAKKSASSAAAGRTEMPRKVALPSARSQRPAREGAASIEAWPDVRPGLAVRRKNDPVLARLKDVETSEPRALFDTLTRMHDGDEERAIRFGLATLDYCAYDGNSQLAADLFRALWPHVKTVELSPGALRGILSHLMGERDLTNAARTAALLILKDPRDPAAVRCLMETAELSRQTAAGQATAQRIYAFLLKHCADSPYADRFRQALTDKQGLNETRGLA